MVSYWTVVKGAWPLPRSCCLYNDHADLDCVLTNPTQQSLCPSASPPTMKLLAFIALAAAGLAAACDP